MRGEERRGKGGEEEGFGGEGGEREEMDEMGGSHNMYIYIYVVTFFSLSLTLCSGGTVDWSRHWTA